MGTDGEGEVTTLCVTGLPGNVTEREVFFLFATFPSFMCGNLKYDAKNGPIAFVTFADKQSASNALKHVHKLEYSKEKTVIRVYYSNKASRSVRNDKTVTSHNKPEEPVEVRQEVPQGVVGVPSLLHKQPSGVIPSQPTHVFADPQQYAPMAQAFHPQPHPQHQMQMQVQPQFIQHTLPHPIPQQPAHHQQIQMPPQQHPQPQPAPQPLPQQRLHIHQLPQQLQHQQLAALPPPQQQPPQPQPQQQQQQPRQVETLPSQQPSQSSQQSPSSMKQQQQCTLFIANIDPQLTDSGLKSLFVQFGCQKLKRSGSKAWLSVDSPKNMQGALCMNNYKGPNQGMALKVAPAKSEMRG